MAAIRQKDTLTLDLLETTGRWTVMRVWEAIPGREGSARVERLHEGYDYAAAATKFERLLRPCVVCGVACPDRETTYRDGEAKRVHYRVYRCRDKDACAERRRSRYASRFLRA